MRFLKTRPSRRDTEVPVFVFGFCYEEMRLMRGLLKDNYVKMPKIFETSQLRARLCNIVRELDRTIDAYEKAPDGRHKFNKQL